MPDTSGQSLIDLIHNYSGEATAAGAALIVREVVALIRGRRREAAETTKVEAEAESILERVVAEKTAQLLAAQNVVIERQQRAIDRMDGNFAALWGYVNVLRNKLVEARISVPPPPSFDHEPRQPSEPPP